MSVELSNAGQPLAVGAVPEDYAEFERYVQRGEKPAETPAKEETPAGTPEPEATPESAGDDKGTPKPEQENEPEGGEPETPAEPKKKGGWQRKIDRLERERNELAQRLAAIEGKLAAPAAGADPEKPAGDAEPRPEDFPGDYEAYIKALTAHTVRQETAAHETKQAQKSAQEQIAQTVEQFNGRAADFKKAHADFDEALADIQDLKFAGAVNMAVLQADNGPAIAYHLGTNRAEAERIAALSPADQLIEIGALKARLSTPVQKATPPKPSKAAEPIAPVGGTGSARAAKTLDDPDLDYAEFERMANSRFRR